MTAASAEAVHKAVDQLLLASSWIRLEQVLAEEPLVTTREAVGNLLARKQAADEAGARDYSVRMSVLALCVLLCSERGVKQGLSEWVAQGWKDAAEFTRWFKPALAGDPEIDLQGELDLAREVLWLAEFSDGPFAKMWEGIGPLIELLLEHWELHGGDATAWEERRRWLVRDLDRFERTSEQWSAKAASTARVIASRFTRAGGEKTVEEAILMFQAALKHHDDPKVRSDLARALLYRFEVSGNESDLATAVVLAEQAAKDLSDPIDKAWALDRAGMALADGFALQGDVRVLDLAIARQSEAVELAPSVPHLLGNLAGSLNQRFLLRRDPADLHRAIELFRAELVLCPTGHELRPDALANFASVFIGAEVEDTPLLAKAIEMLREAIATGGVTPRVLLWRTNLARALSTAEKYEEAATELRAVLDQVDDEHPDRAGILLFLADAEAGMNANPLTRYEAAIEAGVVRQPAAAIMAAQQGARWAMTHDHAEQGRALYRRGLELIDTLATKQRSVADELAWRRGAAAIVDDGAAAFARSGMFEDAVDHVERGRAAILRRSLGATSTLREANRLEDVVAITKTQPLVLLVAASDGGVAIHVGGGNRHIVLLPALSRAAVRDRVSDLLTTQQLRHELAGPARWQAALEAATEWLYQAVFEPYIAALGPLGPRLVLCVDGLVGSLPFSAAWTLDPRAPDGRRFVIDTTALTIMPSASSLVAAMDAATSIPRTSLVVSSPADTGLPSLQGAKAEAARVAALLPGCSVLQGEDATCDQVLAQVANADIVHLAIHGKADLENPMGSGVFLARKQMLTVANLFDQPPRRRRLATLSACETALTGSIAPTEAIGLPGAFLGLGFAAVIGTLWAVSDLATQLLVPTAIESWLGGATLADALAEAQRWLRGLDAEEVYELLGRTTDAQHPFAPMRFWAAFTVSGA